MALGYGDKITYYEDIISNDANKILILGYGGKTIVGFVDGEQVFSTTASYNNEFAGGPLGSADAVNSSNDMARKWSTGGSMAEAVYRPNKLTRMSWQSSSFNALSFDIYVPAVTGEEDQLEQPLNMFYFTLLSEAGGVFGQTGYKIIPNRYSVTQFGSQENALSVKIGNWFYSYNAWVMTSGSVTFSKEKVAGSYPSKPLYVKISCVLTPAREFEYEEVASWFRGTWYGEGNFDPITNTHHGLDTLET